MKIILMFVMKLNNQYLDIQFLTLKSASNSIV